MVSKCVYTLLWLLLGWILANPHERKHQHPSVHCVARLGKESNSQWRLGHQTLAVFISFRIKSKVLTMAHKSLPASLLTCWTLLPLSLFVLLWPPWPPRIPQMYDPYSHFSAFNLMFPLPERIFLWIAAWLATSIDLGFYPQMPHCQGSLLWSLIALSRLPARSCCCQPPLFFFSDHITSDALCLFICWWLMLQNKNKNKKPLSDKPLPVRGEILSSTPDAM